MYNLWNTTRTKPKSKHENGNSLREMHEEGGISPEDEEEEVVVVGLTSLLPSVDEKVLVEAVAENDELAAKAASEQDKLDEVKQEDKIDLDENGTRKRKRQKKRERKVEERRTLLVKKCPF